MAGIVYGSITYKITMNIVNFMEADNQYNMSQKIAYFAYYEIPIIILVYVFIIIIGWVRRRKLGRA